MTEAAASPAVAWLPDVTDTEIIGHVQASGWQSPADAVRSHREAMKLIGADRAGRTFTLPKDDTDAEGHKAFRSRIGVPDAAAGYELPIPEGQDGKFAEAVAGWMHEAGVPKKAAQVLAAKWNGHLEAEAQRQQAEQQAALEVEHRQLAADWGAAADKQRDLARRAAIKLGLDESAIDAMEKAQGYAKTLKALAKVGELIGEDKAMGLDIPGGAYSMTPAAAEAIKKAKMGDPTWVAKANTAKGPEWEELQRLDATIAAGRIASMQTM